MIIRGYIGVHRVRKGYIEGYKDLWGSIGFRVLGK